MGHGRLGHVQRHVVRAGHDAALAVEHGADPVAGQPLGGQHPGDALGEDACVEAVDRGAVVLDRHAQRHDGLARDGAGEHIGQHGTRGFEDAHQLGGPAHRGQCRAPGAQGVDLLSSFGVDQHDVVDVLERQGIAGLGVEGGQVAIDQRGRRAQHAQAGLDAGQIPVQGRGGRAGGTDHVTHGAGAVLAVVGDDEVAGQQQAGQQAGHHEHRQAGAYAPGGGGGHNGVAAGMCAGPVAGIPGGERGHPDNLRPLCHRAWRHRRAV